MSRDATLVTLFAEGYARRNPGPGGYAAVMTCGPHRNEISGGYRETTQARMELQAVINGLRSLKQPCMVRVITQSVSIVNAMSDGAVVAWRERNWMRTANVPAANRDLWDELLQLCDRHQVEFVAPRGPIKSDDHERCLAICRLAASRPTSADNAFEAEPQQLEPALLF